MPAMTMMIPENKRKRKLKKMGPPTRALYKTTEDLQILMQPPSKIPTNVHLEEHYFF
jgi:hypothetical protein